MMRRYWAILLAAMLVCALLPQAAKAVGGPGGTVSNAVELNAALGGVHTVSGDTVTLTEDVALNGDGIDIDGGSSIQLDLAGYTISPASSFSDIIIFYVLNGSALTILDSSSDGNGTIEGDLYFVLYCDPSSTVYLCGGQLQNASTTTISHLGTLHLKGAVGQIASIMNYNHNGYSIVVDSDATVVIDPNAYVTVDGVHVDSITKSVEGEVRVYHRPPPTPPKTGDDSMPWLWLGVLLLSAGALAASAARGRGRRRSG